MTRRRHVDVSCHEAAAERSAMSLSRLEIVPDAARRVRIAGVAARRTGLSPRIRADMTALLRPFVVAKGAPWAALLVAACVS